MIHYLFAFAHARRNALRALLCVTAMVFAPLWGAATAANATTWTVNASDSTSRGPWGPTNYFYAATYARPGDVIFMQAGTYYPGEDFGLWASGSAGNPITIEGDPSNGGTYLTMEMYVTNENYVTFQNLNIGEYGNAGQPNAGFYLQGCSNITIQNCGTYNTLSSGIAIWGQYFDQSTQAASTYPSSHILITGNVINCACNGGSDECISIANGVRYATIANNTVENTIGSSDNGTYGGEGIDLKLAVDHAYIYHNLVENIERTGIYVDGGYCPQNAQGTALGVTNSFIFDNTVANVNSSGIRLTSEYFGQGSTGPVQYVYVANNVVYGCASYGFQLYNDANGSYVASQVNTVHDNIWVTNNTIWNNMTTASSSASLYDTDYPATNVHIENNIVGGDSGTNAASGNIAGVQFWDNALQEAPPVNQGGTSVSYVHNLVTNTTWGVGSVTGTNGNVAIGTPGFYNSSNGDFHIASTSSPMYGAGAASSCPYSSSDRDGLPRPVGSRYDVGAYTYANGRYEFVPSNTSSYCMNDYGSGLGNDNEIGLWSNATLPSNNLWYLGYLGSGEYIVTTCVNSGYALTGDGWGSAGKANLWPLNYGGNQEWLLAPGEVTATNSVPIYDRLISVYNNALTLDAGDNAAPGNNVQMYTNSITPNQASQLFAISSH